MEQHGQQMGTLAGTRLSMYLKPQQTAEMINPHYSRYFPCFLLEAGRRDRGKWRPLSQRAFVQRDVEHLRIESNR